MSHTIEDKLVITPGTEELRDAIILKHESDGWDRHNAVHQKTDGEYRNEHNDSQAGVKVGFGGLETYVRGAGGKKYSAHSATAVGEPGADHAFMVDETTIIDPKLEILANQTYGVKINNGQKESPTVKELTGKRAERAAEIINKRAARLLGERATELAKTKIQSLQDGINKVESKSK